LPAISWSALFVGLTLFHARRAACGEWDMCRNGLYTSAASSIAMVMAPTIRVEPEFTVALRPTLGDVGVLLEPTSIAAKAWDHIDRIAPARGAGDHKSCW